MISNQQKFTIQLSLANLVGTNTVEWRTLLAYATLAMIPVLLVFLCFQRYFVRGSLSGSVKGEDAGCQWNRKLLRNLNGRTGRLGGNRGGWKQCKT